MTQRRFVALQLACGLLLRRHAVSYAAQLLRTALLLHASRVRGQTRCATLRSRASLMRGGRLRQCKPAALLLNG